MTVQTYVNLVSQLPLILRQKILLINLKRLTTTTRTEIGIPTISQLIHYLWPQSAKFTLFLSYDVLYLEFITFLRLNSRESIQFEVAHGDIEDVFNNQLMISSSSSSSTETQQLQQLQQHKQFIVPFEKFTIDELLLEATANMDNTIKTVLKYHPKQIILTELNKNTNLKKFEWFDQITHIRRLGDNCIDLIISKTAMFHQLQQVTIVLNNKSIFAPYEDPRLFKSLQSLAQCVELIVLRMITASNDIFTGIEVNDRVTGTIEDRNNNTRNTANDNEDDGDGDNDDAKSLKRKETTKSEQTPTTLQQLFEQCANIKFEFNSFEGHWKTGMSNEFIRAITKYGNGDLKDCRITFDDQNPRNTDNTDNGSTNDITFSSSSSKASNIGFLPQLTNLRELSLTLKFPLQDIKFENKSIHNLELTSTSTLNNMNDVAEEEGEDGWVGGLIGNCDFSGLSGLREVELSVDGGKLDSFSFNTLSDGIRVVKVVNSKLVGDIGIDGASGTKFKLPRFVQVLHCEAENLKHFSICERESPFFKELKLQGLQNITFDDDVWGLIPTMIQTLTFVADDGEEGKLFEVSISSKFQYLNVQLELDFDTVVFVSSKGSKMGDLLWEKKLRVFEDIEDCLMLQLEDPSVTKINLVGDGSIEPVIVCDRAVADKGAIECSFEFDGSRFVKSDGGDKLVYYTLLPLTDDGRRQERDS
ncbi:unnamed protein product [Ambrosiozyma monospora]|uniref:Unnamed protein product n=1 Tax=Ambrosiozyma monospora TaxID=43982 RepID=A0ACB5SR85_AMBMO|nr:unnamed protein product [Ambrosiozyma monospora]